MTITLTSPDQASRAGLADIGALAHDLFSEAMLNDTLDRVLDLGTQTFGCDAAGFLLVTGDQHVEALAASGSDATRADELQVSTRQGPGQQAIARRQPVVVADLRSDSRWRFWAPRAADLGFRSVLSLSLRDGDTSGALTLYSRRSSNFSSVDLAVAQVFAQHAAIAVAIATEREQLMRAVRIRHLVGQAQGILMERHNIPADHALTVLRHYASHLGQELHVVAQRFVQDRTLPTVEEPAPIIRSLGGS